MKSNTINEANIVSALLDYLTESGEEKILPEVTRELQSLVHESDNAKEITVTTVIPLSNSQCYILKKLVDKVLHTDLPIINKINPKILGGLTISVGDWFLNSTISNSLSKLKQSLLF